MIALVYILLATSFVVEAIIIFTQPKNSALRLVMSYFVTLLAMFSASVLFIDKPNVSSSLILLISFFRIINIGRILENRMHLKELKRRTQRTSRNLAIATTLFFYGYVTAPESFSFDDFLYSASLLQVIAAFLLFSSVFVTRRLYRYKKQTLKSDKKLPTVSVCIPARNETQDLPECIESVLASTYHKLEVLVLDDCSHDKTPDIIKKYAHAGVRFIKGQEHGEKWLAKNAAYDKLSDEAKGDVLLFIGVDVRVQPDTITELVGQMGEKEMISVLPKRAEGSEGSFFMQPLRYWWELGLFRFMMDRPPVLSTCWMARRTFLDKVGGFEGIRKSVNPESKLATLARRRNSYSFLIANDTVGVTSVKGAKAQYETALRVRYPHVRRRPEIVLLVLTVEFLFFLLPVVVLVGSFITDQAQVTLMAGAAVGLIMLANAEVYKLAQVKFWPIGLLSAPFLAIADSVVLLKSMWGYEFGKVEWKERNICLPLLFVEKELPKI